MKLNLQQVTLCAADCVQPELALRALEQSLALCDFGAALLCTDAPLACPEPVRRINISRLNSRDDYSAFMFEALPDLIQTPFVLIVQWDGYVLDPRAWNPAFTDYDLIGARWHWHQDGMTVGNGGFTLRSRKLLLALRDPKFAFVPGVAEDELICRRYRPQLIADYAIRFAPEPLADAFSYERSLPTAPTFGFHGLFNMWRHLDDEAMVAMARQLKPHILRSIEFHELLLQYYLLSKFDPLVALYAALKKHQLPETLRAQLLRLTNNAAFCNSLLQLCESRLPD